MSKQRKIHLFNCDHTYKLDAVEDWINTVKSKRELELTAKHYFSLSQMTELSSKTIPELDMDVAVFVVHAHESRLSINEENAGIGYAMIYRALLQKTGDKVIIVIGGDDSYKDEDEEDKEFISRWARRKISSQFSEEFMDGRKSFIFSWDNKHREIHEKALLHFLDPRKKGLNFEYQPPAKRKLPPKPKTPPPKPITPPPVRPLEPEAFSRPYSSLPAEGPHTRGRVQSTKPVFPVESRAHRISDQGARPKEKTSSSTETEDLVILGCNVSEGSMDTVMQEIKKIGSYLKLKKEHPVKNLSPAEIKHYLERNWIKFCVLVVDAKSVKDAYENLPKRRDEYEDLLNKAVDRVAEKIIILVCDSLRLRPKDEEIVHETIYRIVKERGKGFIVWLKNGKVAVDPDVLAQFLLSSKPTIGHMIPQSSRPEGAQGQSDVPSFSATESRQTYMDQSRGHVVHPLEPEPETRYGLEKPNMQQPQGFIQQSNPPANTAYAGHNQSTGEPVLKSKLRYGKISYEKGDLELMSREFQGISCDTARSLLEKCGDIAETQVKIMRDPKDNMLEVIVGDLGITTADNETLMLKTRVRKGLVSFHENDLEFLYPGWRVPVHILENLKSKASEGKLFIISDEKGNLRCCVQSGIKDKAVSAKDKVFDFFILKNKQK